MYTRFRREVCYINPTKFWRHRYTIITTREKDAKQPSESTGTMRGLETTPVIKRIVIRERLRPVQSPAQIVYELDFQICTNLFPIATRSRLICFPTMSQILCVVFGTHVVRFTHVNPRSLEKWRDNRALTSLVRFCFQRNCLLVENRNTVKFTDNVALWQLAVGLKQITRVTFFQKREKKINKRKKKKLMFSEIEALISVPREIE